MSLEFRGFVNIANDVKLVDVANTCKAYFTVVSEEKRKIKETGEVVKTPTFIKCECWDTAAEYVYDNVFRGDLLYIEANLREDKDSEGNKRYYLRVNSFRNFPKLVEGE